MSEPIFWLDRWFRLPDRNFGDHFTTTPGSPVTALSRNPNRIDLFVSGREGGIYTTFSDGSWTDRWDHLADPNFGDQFTIPPGSPVTALSRNPNRIDLFVSGREGAIYTTFWDGDWFHRWERLPDPNFSDQFTIPPGSPVTALSRNPNRIDLFVSGREGGIYTTFWDGDWIHRWERLPDPNFGDQFTIPPGSPVTALSRNPNRIDLFVSGREGGIYTTFSDGSWTDRWDHLADPNFGDQFTIPPGSPVTALSRNPNRIDLFVSGREGAIYTTFWDGDWTHRWERLPDRNFGDHFTTTPGSPVTALSRNPNRIDLFVSGREGGIYTTFSDGSWTDRWDHLADPNFGDQFTIPPGSPVTALSRNPNRIDLFVSGREGAIYSTPDFPDGSAAG